MTTHQNLPQAPAAPPPLRPAAAMHPVRLVALDQLRGFVIVLVVLHHSILAYCTFGHVNERHYALSTAPIVDPQRWVGFDALVLSNDGFFMPLLFMLSGLFVWSGLSRKGAGLYLRQRLLRLGLPFAVAELTVVPLAYYPSFLQAGGAPGFVRFWLTTVTAGPWPSGPPWFIAVLLLFDVLVAAIFVVAGHPGLVRTGPNPVKPIWWFGPVWWFGVVLACSLLAYLPLLAAIGPSRWLSYGPLAIQGSRIGLYATYFAAGILLAGSGPRDVFPLGRQLARQWPGWGLLAALTLTAFILVTAGATHGAGAGLPARLRTMLLGTALAIFCAAACFALPAVFLRFRNKHRALSASLSANSFGIYLLHYPAVTWMQCGLLGVPASAVAKGATVFVVALLASWGGTVLLHRVPGVRHVV